LPPELLQRSGRTPDDLVQRRTERLGPNLSISYRDAPLKIVRGDDVWLIDSEGRAYLDAYNNVARVGHEHPRVVAALVNQARLLNTNTRYLHDHLVSYAERLTAALPAPLGVCYFVNSGSEANDLALRLARTHTGGDDVIVLDWAYHGHLQTLIDISPYKYKRPGGRGKPENVHELELPDAYGLTAIWRVRRWAKPLRGGHERCARNCRLTPAGRRPSSPKRCPAWAGRSCCPMAWRASPAIAAC
jgi:4-aminobutyrate aminotransferase-like enzyme